MVDITKLFTGVSGLNIRQIREVFELAGFETRNKYSIETTEGQQLLYAAEQQKGVFGFLFRQALGHWRTYEIHLFDSGRRQIARAKHPFRFYFQRLEIESAQGAPLGIIEKRFSILSKRFDVMDRHGRVILEVNSPLLKIWTFPFMRNGEEMAVVRKKWAGFLQEGFLDADRFQVEFSSSRLTDEEKLLVTVAGLFIDLKYFERKAQR